MISITFKVMPMSTCRAPTADASDRTIPLPAAQRLSFGERLRTWRTARRYSQLALALEAGVSQRHLSFLESGRAGPSRDMVMLLAQVLQLPLRERNEWLTTAGFAPCFAERALGEAEMAAVRQALELTLQHHDPYPALVVNRRWEVVMHNLAFERLLAALAAPASVDALWQRVDPSGRRNLVRLSLHPEGLRPRVVDWPQVAAVLMARLAHEVQADPAHTALAALLAELRAWPGVAQAPSAPASLGTAAVAPPVLSLQLRLSGSDAGMGEPVLSLFSMICGFGTALDLTADELRLELMFPADPASTQWLRDIAAALRPHPPATRDSGLMGQ